MGGTRLLRECLHEVATTLFSRSAASVHEVRMRSEV
jgi:hypothetical protein